MKWLPSAFVCNIRMQGKGVFLETEYMSLSCWGKRRNGKDIFHISLWNFNVLMHYLIHSKQISVIAHVQAICAIHVQFVHSFPDVLEPLHKSWSVGNSSALAHPYDLYMPVEYLTEISGINSISGTACIESQKRKQRLELRQNFPNIKSPSKKCPRKTNKPPNTTPPTKPLQICWPCCLSGFATSSLPSQSPIGIPWLCIS